MSESEHERQFLAGADWFLDNQDEAGGWPSQVGITMLLLILFSCSLVLLFSCSPSEVGRFELFMVIYFVIVLP